MGFKAWRNAPKSLTVRWVQVIPAVQPVPPSEVAHSASASRNHLILRFPLSASRAPFQPPPLAPTYLRACCTTPRVRGYKGDRCGLGSGSKRTRVLLLPVGSSLIAGSGLSAKKYLVRLPVQHQHMQKPARPAKYRTRIRIIEGPASLP